MLRIRFVLSALIASVLVFGTAMAAGVAFDASGFDPFEEDEGYIELILEDDVLTVVFDEAEGSLPATMEGDTLPLDGDFDEDLLGRPDALALYGGLPVGTTPTTVTLDVDGRGTAIRDALLARLTELGIDYGECFEGGPICTFELSHGEANWLLSVTPHGTGATINIQVMR